MTSLETIATIQTEFPEKFGIPRQSGLVEGLRGTIVFEPAFRNPDAVRGLSGFSHLWLLWGFSGVDAAGWSPTVRPPRLGGNQRVGVFATRSPFRPNPIGLSCVKLLSVQQSGTQGPVILVSGADLMSGTPIYDIKPYLPYADCHPEATGGFAGSAPEQILKVNLPHHLAALLPPGAADTLCATLAQDPRPPYQNDPHRTYGMAFLHFEVKFQVEGDALTVASIQKRG